MRATLHDHAPNTYYGQWPSLARRKKLQIIAAHCPSEARCETGIPGPLMPRGSKPRQNAWRRVYSFSWDEKEKSDQAPDSASAAKSPPSGMASCWRVMRG
jgi:hypothetical protein